MMEALDVPHVTTILKPITCITFVMSPSQRFIDDLVPLILESDEHGWWPRDLLRLALVSSAWVRPVQKRLYASPTLCSFQACNLFAQSLLQNPSLSVLVKAIDIRPSEEIGGAKGFVTEKETASLRFILSLDGLLSVTLGGQLAVGAERFLHSLSHSDSVTRLHIDGSFGCGIPRCGRAASLEWDEAMAFMFPRLRTLILSNLDLDIMPPPFPYDTEHEHLALHNVQITSGYLPHLFHGSWSSLQSLFVIAGSASDFDDQMRLVLDCCSANLQSLHYEVRDTFSDQPIFDHNFPKCPSLRHLYLSGVELDFTTLSHIAANCKNLAGLSVSGRIVRITPREWVTFLSSCTLPSLRVLCTPGGTNYPPFMYWSEDARKEVADASAARGVQQSWPSSPAYSCTFGAMCLTSC
jgi:hypothetical protein